jgi:hypothetical protein
VLAVLAIANGTTTLISLWWLRSETTTRSYAQTAAIDVRADCGSVTIRGADIARARVTAHDVWTFSRPKLTTTVQGGTRTIRSRCGSHVMAGVGGSQSLTVTVPAETRVTVSSDSSTVHVDGIAGDVSARSSSGGVEGSLLRAPRVTARSSAGGVSLSFAAPPEQVRASSSSGGVTVLLPDGPETYRVEVSSSSGSTRTDVRTDPTSTRTIDATSSAGPVRVAYSD